MRTSTSARAAGAGAVLVFGIVAVLSQPSWAQSEDPKRDGADTTGTAEEVSEREELAEEAEETGGTAPESTEEAAAAPGIENIVITSERRESLVQETPLAISAFSGADLDAQGYLNFEDLSLNIPNVQFGRTIVDGGGFTIRGVSSSAGDRATAFHVDGIYVNRNAAAEGITFFDNERVEVLRGPQGTLYGRNATGGAINVISARPTNEFGMAGDFRYGSYNETIGRAWVNLPFKFLGLDEKVFLRVSGIGNFRDGFQENLSGNVSDYYDDAHDWGVRTQLRALPTDGLDITLRYTYSRRKGVGPGLKILGDFADPVVLAGFNVDVYCVTAAAKASGCDISPNPKSKRQVHLDVDGTQDNWDHWVNGQLEWDVPVIPALGPTSVQLRGSWIRRQAGSQNDGDGSDGPLSWIRTATERPGYTRFVDPSNPNGYVLETTSGCQAQLMTSVIFGGAGASFDESGCTLSHSRTDEWVGEIQWANAGEGNLDWLLGGFYLRSRFTSGGGQLLAQPLPWVEGIGGLGSFFRGASLSGQASGDSNAQSWAIFGQSSYRFGTETETVWDDFTPTVGLRYTQDKKRAAQYRQEVGIFGIPIQAQADIDYRDRALVPTGSLPGDPEASDTWEAVTGLARVQWDWSEQRNLYFSISRGFKSGTIETTPLDPADATTSFPNAKPEVIWAYELGSKNRLFDGRLQANLTWFYYDYKDLQVTTLFGLDAITTNAAKASIWGMEGEFVALPLLGQVDEFWDQLRVIVNAGYLKTKYSKYENCPLPEGTPNTMDCSGNQLTRAPPYSVTGILSYPFDFGKWGTVTPNTQIYASGKVFFRATNCPNEDCGTRGAFNNDYQPAYWLLNARLTWRSEDGRFEVQGFIDNIFNKDIIQNQITGSSLLGFPIQVRFDAPRQAGFRVSAAW